MNPKNALLVALVTVALDFVFHLAFTQPMEVPYYFAAKFIGAFLVALLILPTLGPLRSAIAFTALFDIYYYVGVLVLHLNYLSSSPTQIIEIAGVTQPFFLFALWTLFHGAFFYIGARAVGRKRGR